MNTPTTEQKKSATHVIVPVPLFGVMMNLLYKRPYGQVAEVVQELMKCEGVVATPNDNTTAGFLDALQSGGIESGES